MNLLKSAVSVYQKEASVDSVDSITMSSDEEEEKKDEKQLAQLVFEGEYAELVT